MLINLDCNIDSSIKVPKSQELRKIPWIFLAIIRKSWKNKIPNPKYLQLKRAAKEVGLEVNERKTNYLVVSRSKRTAHADQNFTFGKYNFERVSSYNHLGKLVISRHNSKHQSQNLLNRTSPSCNIRPGNLCTNRKEQTGTGSFRTWSSSIRTSKNTKSPVGREKLRTHPSGSRLFGRPMIDRFEGQMAWPSCSCMYVPKNPKRSKSWTPKISNDTKSRKFLRNFPLWPIVQRKFSISVHQKILLDSCRFLKIF